ncbi:MAG: hypothetical protein ACRDXF_12010 [Acidimicrobiia bacterium]
MRVISPVPGRDPVGLAGVPKATYVVSALRFSLTRSPDPIGMPSLPDVMKDVTVVVATQGPVGGMGQRLFPLRPALDHAGENTAITMVQASMGCWSTAGPF